MARQIHYTASRFTALSQRSRLPSFSSQTQYAPPPSLPSFSSLLHPASQPQQALVSPQMQAPWQKQLPAPASFNSPPAASTEGSAGKRKRQFRLCHECGATESPEWRKGPRGPATYDKL
eukprot:TRINITY_DN4331_c0_g1_i2.p1 TRINITY_DN4331_c0_g1~~TRINITY_DN4331_c0_g1_i2.p1  ORF type:complete len:119 (-),score=4.34 TRINITY_DN4331_c0_g1_i2:67-423(-)